MGEPTATTMAARSRDEFPMPADLVMPAPDSPIRGQARRTSSLNKPDPHLRGGDEILPFMPLTS